MKNILVPLPEEQWREIKNKKISLKDILLKILRDEPQQPKNNRKIKRCCVSDHNGELTKLWANYARKVKKENKTLLEISKEISNYLRYL